jgi:hypothetical protein
VKSSSLHTFVALYGLGLGASSRDEVKFRFGVLVAIMYSISYGSNLVMEDGVSRTRLKGILGTGATRHRSSSG